MKEGIRKEALQRQLERLERNKKPLEEELDRVNAEIQKTKEKLDQLKDVVAVKQTFFI